LPQFAVFRPGDRPMAEFAAALAGAPGDERGGTADTGAAERGPISRLDCVRPTRFAGARATAGDRRPYSLRSRRLAPKGPVAHNAPFAAAGSAGARRHLCAKVAVYFLKS
jgi:hypothetical protein